MTDRKTRTGLALLTGFLFSSLALVWGGGLIWFGWPLLAASTEVKGGGDVTGQVGSAGLSMVGFGVLLVAAGLFGIIHRVMKARAPALRGSALEETQPGFDADAAIRRYLAEKGSAAKTGDAAPSLRSADAPPPPPPPLFGRRSAPPQA